MITFQFLIAYGIFVLLKNLTYICQYEFRFTVFKDLKDALPGICGIHGDKNASGLQDAKDRCDEPAASLHEDQDTV